MKDNYTKSDVKNAKHAATIGGIILGTIAVFGIGIVIKKKTNSNILDGAETLFDKAIDKIKTFIDERKHGGDDSAEFEPVVEDGDSDSSEFLQES